jgi:hypothetical protein
MWLVLRNSILIIDNLKKRGDDKWQMFVALLSGRRKCKPFIHWVSNSKRNWMVYS